MSIDDEFDDIELPASAVPPSGQSPVMATCSLAEIAAYLMIPKHLLDSMFDSTKDTKHA